MLRAFRFAIVAAIVLALAWGVASLRGHVSVDFGPYVATAPSSVAVVLLLVVAIILTLLISIVLNLLRAPRRLAARRALSRRDAADAASLRALSALAAGDDAAAGSHARLALRHAPDAPLTLYVAGETARRAGDHAVADASFTTLATHKDAGFLGWHGLLRHHAAAGTEETAAQARLAAVAYPNSAWLRDRRVQLALGRGDYAEAARLATGRPARAALAITAARHADSRTLAVDWAREAVRAAPGLAAAWLALHRAHAAAGHPRRAKRALTRGWKAAPHPDLAEAWLAGIATPIERARAAQSLAASNPGHPESEALLARTAAAADLAGEARRHAEGAGAAGTAWVCAACETAHEDWRPVCRKCGAIGSLGWAHAPADPVTTVLLPAPPPA